MLAVHVVKAVESACQCKALNGLLVACLQIDTLYEIINVFVLTILLTLLYDGLYSGFADTLDTAQTKAHIAVLGHGEVQTRLIDIRCEDRHTHSFALVHELGNILNVVLRYGQVGCHELGRVVGFEVSRLVGYP